MVVISCIIIASLFIILFPDNKEFIIETWKAYEKADFENFDSAVDQATADAHLQGLNGNSTDEIIQFYLNLNQSDNNFVCRHRAARIIAENIILHPDTEICAVSGYLEDASGMTFYPTEDHTGSGHMWVEYEGKIYDYLVEGIDFEQRITLAKRCYRAWSKGPTRLNNTGFEDLYAIYEREVLSLFAN